MQVVVFCKHVLILQNKDSNFLTLKEHNNLSYYISSIKIHHLVFFKQKIDSC